MANRVRKISALNKTRLTGRDRIGEAESHSYSSCFLSSQFYENSVPDPGAIDRVAEVVNISQHAPEAGAHPLHTPTPRSLI